jgi:hypothetical protein
VKPKRKPARAPRDIHVGTYELGYEKVDLWLMPSETGGCFEALPANQPRTIIKVGGDYQQWHRVVEVLIHEAVEFAMCRQHVRFKRDGDLTSEAASFHFILDHTDFSEAIACAAEFITASEYPLNKAWKANRQKR